MKKAHKVIIDKKEVWVCGCGSQLEAKYNILNKFNCPDNERVCAICFGDRDKK